MRQKTRSTTKSGMPGLPRSGTEEPFHLVMCPCSGSRIVNQGTGGVGSQMVSEKSTSSNGRAKPRSVGSESREPAERKWRSLGSGTRICERPSVRLSTLINCRNARYKKVQKRSAFPWQRPSLDCSMLKSRSSSRRPRNSCYRPSPSRGMCDLLPA